MRTPCASAGAGGGPCAAGQGADPSGCRLRWPPSLGPITAPQVVRDAAHVPSDPTHPHLLCPQRSLQSHSEGFTCPWRCLPTDATARLWFWPTIKPISLPSCPWSREISKENKVRPLPERQCIVVALGAGGLKGSGRQNVAAPQEAHLRTLRNDGVCTYMVYKYIFMHKCYH